MYQLKIMRKTSSKILLKKKSFCLLLAAYWETVNFAIQCCKLLFLFYTLFMLIKFFFLSDLNNFFEVLSVVLLYNVGFYIKINWKFNLIGSDKEFRIF